MNVRVTALLVTIGILVPLSANVAAATDVPASFTFAGSGWGHGVGMSQYGALGLAREGKSEQEIVQYYYPGTTVQSVTDDANIRVNLLFQVKTATIRLSGAAGSQMQIFAGDTQALDASPVAELTGNQTLNVVTEGSAITPSITSSEVSTRIDPGNTFTIRWSGTRYLPGVDGWARIGTNASAPLYRYGQLVVKSVKVGSEYRVNVSNDVRIHDEYLKGIAEMPSSWPPAALKAQAMASRSFALSRYGTGKINSSCFCNVYSSQKDQRFAGYAKEAEANWGQKWVAAVTETSTDEASGLAITNAGTPIAAYFFSSSGGRTQEMSEVWGTTLPWLVSVPDPWSLDPTVNPTYASWVRTIGQDVVAKAFALPDVVSVTFPTRTVGGGIKSAVGVSSSGQVATLSGEIFRSRTGLPSTYLGRSVSRVASEDLASLAVMLAKIAQPSARTAVLGDDGSTDIITAVAASSLAGSLQQPLFFLSKKKLPAATLAEIKSRKITNVTVVGTKEVAPDSVLNSLRKAGIATKRLSAASYSATAALVAKGRTGQPILVSSQDPELAAATVAVARLSDRPVFFVTSAGPTATTLSALKTMQGKVLTVVGRSSSIPDAWLAKLAAIIPIEDQRGEDMTRLATTLAGDSIRVLIAVTPGEALAASVLGQPVLIASPTEIPMAVNEWLTTRSQLAQVTVVGNTLPADVAETLKVQR